MESRYHLCQQKRYPSPPVYFKSYPIETTLKCVEGLKNLIGEQIQSLGELDSLRERADGIEVQVYKVVLPLQCPSSLSLSFCSLDTRSMATGRGELDIT